MSLHSTRRIRAVFMGCGALGVSLCLLMAPASTAAPHNGRPAPSHTDGGIDDWPASGKQLPGADRTTDQDTAANGFQVGTASE